MTPLLAHPHPSKPRYRGGAQWHFQIDLLLFVPCIACCIREGGAWANGVCAAKNSVVKKGGYSVHCLAFGYHLQFDTELGGSLVVEEGAISGNVRPRGKLRIRTQALVSEIKTQDGLPEAPRQRLGGVLRNPSQIRCSRCARGKIQ